MTTIKFYGFRFVCRRDLLDFFVCCSMNFNSFLLLVLLRFAGGGKVICCRSCWSILRWMREEELRFGCCIDEVCCFALTLNCSRLVIENLISDNFILKLIRAIPRFAQDRGISFKILYNSNSNCRRTTWTERVSSVVCPTAQSVAAHSTDNQLTILVDWLCSLCSQLQQKLTQNEDTIKMLISFNWIASASVGRDILGVGSLQTAISLFLAFIQI